MGSCNPSDMQETDDPLGQSSKLDTGYRRFAPRHRGSGRFSVPTRPPPIGPQVFAEGRMQDQRQAMVEQQSPLAHVHIHLTSLLDKGDFSVTIHVQGCSSAKSRDRRELYHCRRPRRQTDRGHEEKRENNASHKRKSGENIEQKAQSDSLRAKM